MVGIRPTDVFTPTSPARFAFVERRSLNDRLVDALTTPGKQVVVFGPSGSGKTTLLVNKLEQLYPDHITTRCTAATTFEALLLSAFDHLNLYYSSTASIKKGKSISAKLETDYFGIKSAVEAAASGETQVGLLRLLPPQLTPQRVAEFCGAAGCCWVWEDFHKVPRAEKARVAQMMKVFMDTAAEFPDVRIVAVGAVDSAREVVQYDPEMRNRVAEVAVPLMTPDELDELLKKGESLLKIRLGRLRHEISKYSSGLAAVCHQLGLNICFAAGIHETCNEEMVITEADLRAALERYLSDASDTLKAVFELAMKQQRVRTFDNARLILRAMARLGDSGGSHAEILKIIREAEPKFPASNLTAYLSELQSSKRAEILRYSAASGKYFFSDPLYLAYSQCLLVPPKKDAWKIRLMDFDFDVTNFNLVTTLLPKEPVVDLFDASGVRISRRSGRL
jgi:energy-coupling factor transporter ATP-binding protein EcfA2